MDDITPPDKPAAGTGGENPSETDYNDSAGPQAPSEGSLAGDAGTEPVTPAAPPQPFVSDHISGRRWPKFLLILLVILLAGGGWYAYKKHKDNTDKSAASAVQSKDIAVLKIGLIQTHYGNLYPDMSVNEYGYLTNSQMFEGLVRYQDKSKIVPDLASTWTNPDSRTWLFTVKSGVKFHDGHTLAASDVKYSLDKVIASDSDLSQAFATTISSVDVVGTNQVKITTKTPDPALLNRLAFLYVIDANLPKGDEPSQAGTGPYQIKPGTTPTDTSVRMVAFNGYHGGKPATKALDFGNAKDDAAAIDGFKSGRFNIVGPLSVSDTGAVKGATSFITTEPDVNYLGFNTVKPGPLKNKLVREAIRYAVNPVAIGKADGTQVTPLSQMIPQSIPGYNPAIAPYKQDISKAKKLLAQAGYPNGLAIRLATASDPQLVTEIVNELKQAGIKVTVDRHDNFDEFINYFSTGQAEMFEVDYSSDTLDGLDIYTTTIDPANYSNPKFTDLLNQASAATDPAKRLKLLQDAAVIIDQDIPAVALSTQDNLWLMDKNYAIHQDMPSSFISAYFYKVHLN